MHSIKEAVFQVKNRIEEAKLKAGRKDEVSLIAVSKFQSVEKIEEAKKCGILHFGENRAQEAYEKFRTLKAKYPEIVLHFIGHLQRNKVRKVIEVSDTIDSVDSKKLLLEIEKICSALKIKKEIMIEVHTGEESKGGFRDINEMKEAVSLALKSDFLKLRGMMSVAPMGNAEEIRRSFAFTRRIRDDLFPSGSLSMGMSGDFEEAISEGSSEVRIGTLIFGERK